MTPNATKLYRFIKESNMIERITRMKAGEWQEYNTFLALDKINTDDLEKFLKVIQPDAVLRDHVGHNVYVGGYTPPDGGPWMRENLWNLLKDAQEDTGQWHAIHHRFELMHPFSDGNGRLGRLVWLWMRLKANMLMDNQYPFLQQWYYDSLSYGNE